VKGYTNTTKELIQSQASIVLKFREKLINSIIKCEAGVELVQLEYIKTRRDTAVKVITKFKEQFFTCIEMKNNDEKLVNEYHKFRDSIQYSFAFTKEDSKLKNEVHEMCKKVSKINSGRYFSLFGLKLLM